MVKDNILKNALVTIKRLFPRFLSLMVMSFLGVFTFSGLQATSPDMIKTLDNYYDTYNNYDIKVASSGGLKNTDLKMLSSVDGVKEIEGSYSNDFLIKVEGAEFVLNVSSLSNKINKVELIEGRMPSKDNEIVVEEKLLKDKNLNINDTLKVNSYLLLNNEVTIVGTCKSSLYINNTNTSPGRGNTLVGAGTINYYSFASKECFSLNKLHVYTSIYMTVEGAKEEITSSKKYVSLVENVKDNIEKVKEKNNITSTWNIMDRSDYTTYSEYIDDANSIANLAILFPSLFFAVAILVSLVSMNRMVEEDRLEIGTFKSLGFSNRHILKKYVIFSSLATLIGGLFGSALGLIIIPYMIFNIYTILFAVSNFNFTFNTLSTLLSFFISFICICGTSVITVLKVVKEKPCDLMRPKAPKNGKKIFLEKFPKLWSKISFSNKITIRNLFRYKKRVTVTLCGIIGCTALILSGFGLRDGILATPNESFDNILTYDAMAYVSDKNIDDNIFDDERILSHTKMEFLTVSIDGLDANLVISDNLDDLHNFITLEDLNSNESLSLEDNKVIVTDKMFQLKDYSIGKTINLFDLNNKEYSYEISGVCKNYFKHYLFINTATFVNSGGEYNPNMVILKTKELSKEEQDDLARNLLSTKKVINVTYKSQAKDNASNMLKSLNSVVIILILLASMLSFIVLYNLSNINIQERKREIATLKVLGFYNKEVDNYITKENIIITIFGIAIGLFAGYFLTMVTLSTVEIEAARFIRAIEPISYLYASILTIIFTIIVNIVAHFNLKRINMIESLKSVE